jgi:hypothetical protein
MNGKALDAYTIANPRPLTGWVRVTGKKTYDGGWFWVVDGVAGGVPTKFMLRHPPEEERQLNFLVSEAKKAQAESQRAGKIEERAGALAETKGNEANAYQSAAIAVPSDPLNFGPLGNQRAAEAARYSNLSRRAGQSSLQAATYRASLQSQMYKIPHELLGNDILDIKYRLDLFALRTGEVYQGLPVFDLGSMQ